MKKIVYFILFSLLAARAFGDLSDYQIGPSAAEEFADKNALTHTRSWLDERPEIRRRLLDTQHLVPSQGWGYHSQTYGSAATMEHLIALQIKAMAERGAIDQIEDLFDPKYGIGSKDHKDKGTLNNPLSFWGHPVQTEILGQRGKLNALAVYHAFRKTIKNDLIRYARNQPLEWHLRPISAKLADLLNFLEQHHSAATDQLRHELKERKLSLETLIERALETDLLS